MRGYRGAFLRAREQYPQKAEHMNRCLSRLSSLEKANSLDIDRVAGVFGDLLGDVFAFKEDIWKNILYDTGFFLGKFIYLMDAYEDIATDEKSGSYNILLLRKKALYGNTEEEEKRFEQDCHQLLLMMMAECTARMDLLPCIQDAAILRNILYDGVWNRYQKLQKEKKLAKQKRMEKNYHG